MKHSHRMRVSALAAGTVIVAAACAQEPTPGQLQAQIEQLQARVQALQAQQKTHQQNTAAAIDAILRDAARRSRLLVDGSPTMAGYDRGRFWVGSADGAFLLRPGALFQFRGVGAWSEHGKGGGRDSTEGGFEVARARLELDGTAFTPEVTYFFEVAAEDGQDVQLDSAWVRYQFTDNWSMRVGQFKDPVHHEELTSSRRQLAVDRSLVNEVLGGGLSGRVQGMSLIYGGHADSSPLSGEMAVHDGLDSQNTRWPDEPGPGGASQHWGMAGRLEYRAMGDWRNYTDFTARGTESDLLVLGAGGDYTEADDATYVLATADVQWENTGGLGVYGAALLTWTDPDAGHDLLNWGAVLQAGYMLSPAWEVFGRYGLILTDDAVAVGDSTEDTFHEFAVGVNRYLGRNGSAGHRAKITIDLTWLPQGAPSEQDEIDVPAGNGEAQVILRGQFQLVL